MIFQPASRTSSIVLSVGRTPGEDHPVGRSPVTFTMASMVFENILPLLLPGQHIEPLALIPAVRDQLMAALVTYLTSSG